MSKTIFFGGALITLCDTDFECPACTCLHFEKDYYTRLYNSEKGLIYKSCKGCKAKLGITYDIKGDVVVWLKSEEKNKSKFFKPS